MADWCETVPENGAGPLGIQFHVSPPLAPPLAPAGRASSNHTTSEALPIGAEAVGGVGVAVVIVKGSAPLPLDEESVNASGAAVWPAALLITVTPVELPADADGVLVEVVVVEVETGVIVVEAGVV